VSVVVQLLPENPGTLALEGRIHVAAGSAGARKALSKSPSKDDTDEPSVAASIPTVKRTLRASAPAMVLTVAGSQWPPELLWAETSG